MEFMVHKKSAVHDGAYVGTLLNSLRAADVEIEDRQDWYSEGSTIPLVEHFNSSVGGSSSDPFQRLTLSMTQNLKWLIGDFEALRHGNTPPILVSTSRDAALHTIPIELELVCKRCSQSADFLANVELCASWLARSKRPGSVMDRLLRNAEATSTLEMFLPVNLAHRGADLLGALRVESISEISSSGTLYLVTNERMSLTREALCGVELMRRVQYKAENRQEVKTLEAAVGKVR